MDSLTESKAYQTHIHARIDQPTPSLFTQRPPLPLSGQPTSSSLKAVNMEALAPSASFQIHSLQATKTTRWNLGGDSRVRLPRRISAVPDNNNTSSPVKKAGGVPSNNYVVPLDSHIAASSSCLTRPLVEILRDLNKRVPDKVIKSDGAIEPKYIPWYHANRMLSFYAPGWCGEVRNVIFSADAKSVSVVYRVTVRGTDGEAYREASGTVLLDNTDIEDPVQVAEAMAFRRACARFGLGLYLYHEDETQ